MNYGHDQIWHCTFWLCVIEIFWRKSIQGLNSSAQGSGIWNFSDRTIGCGVIDPCTQGVACVHARKVVDGHWTIFGKIMGIRFWNFSDRTIGCGVIDPCTQGVACLHVPAGFGECIFTVGGLQTFRWNKLSPQYETNCTGPPSAAGKNKNLSPKTFSLQIILTLESFSLSNQICYCETNCSYAAPDGQKSIFFVLTFRYI